MLMFVLACTGAAAEPAPSRGDDLNAETLAGSGGTSGDARAATSPMVTLAPDPLPTGDFVAISLGAAGGCTLDVAGALGCFPLGSLSGPPAPGVKLPPGPFAHVWGDASAGCASTDAGKAVCWGGAEAMEAAIGGRAVKEFSLDYSGQGCAVLADEQLVCVGRMAPAPVARARDVETTSGACVATATGVQCWAYRDHAIAGDFTDVGVAGFGTCAVSSEGLRCEGYARPLPPTDGWTEIEGGFDHFCGRRHGLVACFGPPESEGVRVPADARAYAVASGMTCWVAADGSLGCAGGGFHPGLPVGGVRDVTVTEEGGCALLANGDIHCFGERSGLGGDLFGSAAGAAGAAAGGGPFVSMSADKHVGCGLDAAGAPRCWGPLAVPPGVTFRQLDVGLGYACGVRTDGTLQCFDNADDAYTSEVAAPPAGTFTTVQSAVTWSCALAPDGRVSCWGKKDYSDFRYELQPPPDDTFTSISAGYNHHCGIVRDGTIRCWGRDRFGETVPPAGAFLQVDAGECKTCALDLGGVIRCWGREDAPGRIPAGAFVRVAVEKYNDEGTPGMVCGVRSDGTLACGWF
ncbi:MAG: RCC1 domain-containing protein [Myxococcota bacterium]